MKLTDSASHILIMKIIINSITLYRFLKERRSNLSEEVAIYATLCKFLMNFHVFADKVSENSQNKKIKVTICKLCLLRY